MEFALVKSILPLDHPFNVIQIPPNFKPYQVGSTSTFDVVKRGIQDEESEKI